MNNFSNPNRVSADNTVTSAANTDGEITLTPGTGRSVVMSGIAWSYSGGESDITGGITIKDEDDATYFDLDVTTAGAGILEFKPPIMGPVGKAMVLTVKAAGADVVGKLNVINSGQA